MFEHVILFLSFIYAIALTHLLSSATDLILSRDRVKASGLLIGWMVVALLMLVSNWLAAAALSSIKHWTTGEALLQFADAIVQYFTCSLVSIRTEAEGKIDMPAFFEKHRRVILLAFSALGVAAMIENFVDRNTSGLAPASWISEDLQILPLNLVLLAALVFRRPWVQWAAMLIMFVANTAFAIQFVAVG
jgi:hypothetical protein